jgi:hypothetical protein
MFSPKFFEIRTKLLAFMHEHVWPAEESIHAWQDASPNRSVCKCVYVCVRAREREREREREAILGVCRVVCDFGMYAHASRCIRRVHLSLCVYLISDRPLSAELRVLFLRSAYPLTLRVP